MSQVEVYLYMCESCKVCMFSEEDQGELWYTNCVGVCAVGTFYYRVRIGINNGFVVVEEIDEE